MKAHRFKHDMIDVLAQFPGRIDNFRKIIKINAFIIGFMPDLCTKFVCLSYLFLFKANQFRPSVYIKNYCQDISIIL